MINAPKIYFYVNILLSPTVITQLHYRRCVRSVLSTLAPAKQISTCNCPDLKLQQWNQTNDQSWDQSLASKLSRLVGVCSTKVGDSFEKSSVSSNEKLDNMAASNCPILIEEDDEEIAILGEYNPQVERAKKAIEIVLEDEEDPSVQQNQPNLQSCSVPARRQPVNENTSTASTSAVVPPLPMVVQPNDPAEIAWHREAVEKFRSWESTNLGAGMAFDPEATRDVTFSFMSYNVLAQALLEEHPNLYERHDPRALGWQHRSSILLKELANANADIICLQEVQEDHLTTFYNRLQGLGYKGLYKRRTGGKKDGLAIYYRKSKFSLVDQTSVEFYQPGVERMNRDNVGLIATLALKGARGYQRQVTVANTHLLFNPRREDIRLGQTQLLLAEVDRMAFLRDDRRDGRPMYHPLIIAGDFNTPPNSEVHRLLSTGVLRYEGLPLGKQSQPLSRSLLPRQLEVTDTCQHFSILCKRPRNESSTEQRKRLMIYHSELNVWGSFKNYVEEMRRRGLVNGFTPLPQIPIPLHRRTMPPNQLPPDGFSTGQLSHNLSLRSVYRCMSHGMTDITTFQDKWTTVDYIFYGGRFIEDLDCVVEGELKLVSRLRLPRAVEAEYIGPIPNLAVPSDHYPLAAIFTFK